MFYLAINDVNGMSLGYQCYVRGISMGSQWDANKPSLRCPIGMSLASHACTHRRSAMPMTCQEAKFRLTQLRSHCHVSDIPLCLPPFCQACHSARRRLWKNPSKKKLLKVRAWIMATIRIITGHNVTKFNHV